MNPYLNYYATQAGSGLGGFQGVRYQRGHGFFGKLLSAVLPALKYLGKQSLSTGMNLAEDVLSGKNFKESRKSRAIEAGKETAKTAIKRGRKYVQTGKGRSKIKKLEVWEK